MRQVLQDAMGIENRELCAGLQVHIRIHGESEADATSGL